MQGSFVNLNRVRQQQAREAAAAEAARIEAEAAAAQAQEEVAPSTPPSSSSLSPPRPTSSSTSTGPSPPRSPFRAPQIQSSLLVRRHNTVGGKPQRTRSVKRVEEEDEEGPENDGAGDSYDGGDSASVTTEESGYLPGAPGLTRHGSLPTRTAPYPISPVRAGFSSSSATRPRFGSHRSSGPTTPYESIASVTGGAAANDLHAYGAEDDEEWERALAEGRRNGGAAAAGEDYYDPDPEILSSSAPKGSSQLQHQRSLPHQRSLQYINTSGSASAGSRSPPLLPPHQYHQQQQQSGSSFFPSSSNNPPASPSYEDAAFNHQRSISSKTSVESSIASGGPTVRRHQSLTQAGVHSRISDRLNRSPFTDPNSRAGSDDDPPTSPVKRSPWSSPQQDLLSRQRSWDGDQSQGGGAGSGGGPLSPVPGSGSRWRREESGSSAEGAMSAEQLQNAFDAISLGRSMQSSTSSLQPPPPLPRSGATSPDPYSHSRSASGSNTNLSLNPPQPVDRGRHSRSPSLNPPPPRFASPSPGPPSSSTPTPNDAPVRPSVTVPPSSFPHHHRPGLSNNSSPASSGGGNGNLKLSLITDATALAQGPNLHSIPRVGPQSAAAFVPPVGHSTQPPLSSGGFVGGGAGYQHQFGGPLVGIGGYAGGGGVGGSNGLGNLSNQPKQAPFTAMGTGWEQKHTILGSRPPPPQLPYGQPQQQQMFGGGPYGGNQQQQFAPSMQQSFGQQANFLSGAGSGGGYGGGMGMEQGGGGMMGGAGAGGLASPVDVPSLVQAKGYNPAVFDTNPTRARFFVIKSYTEDDVAKSLKFEIWSSTTFGNKRLDKAFKESAAVMPIYLFFSVNSSGHFAGVAQMLTEVDYNTTSTVWAQDKWKGVFRLRWVFVKDVPNQALRHIRLNNTQERKPVTNSRDTQELLPEAGIEMLKIFHSYQSRTSLLQDYAFYDLQSIQKDLQSQAEAAQQPQQQQQPIAHLPPFPAQPTFVPQPLGPNYASSEIYATGKPSFQNGGAGGGGGQQGRY